MRGGSVEVTPPSRTTTPEQAAALTHAISADRLNTYLRLTDRDVERATALYIWNRDLSLAILADIAIVEVALRNALHMQLSATWGERWYADPSLRFDRRSADELKRAWNHLPDNCKRSPGRDATEPGKLVAHCMMGFWVNLLDRGDYIGDPPRRVRADYEDLWRITLSKAFPGGRAEARRSSTTYTRNWTHSVALQVRDLRNRIAHHESLVNGFPLPGQGRRLSAMQGHEEVLRLARMLDRDLEGWLKANTSVPELLARRPAVLR